MSSSGLLFPLASFVLHGALPPAALFLCLLFIPAGVALALVSHAQDADDDDAGDDDLDPVHGRVAVESATRSYLQALEASLPCPLDEAVIDIIPLLQYQDRPSSALDEGFGDSCVVCLCPFEQEEMVRVLPPCDHCFHVPCIGPWLQSHSTCPLCRSKIAVLSDLCHSQTKENQVIVVKTL